MNLDEYSLGLCALMKRVSRSEIVGHDHSEWFNGGDVHFNDLVLRLNIYLCAFWKQNKFMLLFCISRRFLQCEIQWVRRYGMCVMDDVAAAWRTVTPTSESRATCRCLCRVLRTVGRMSDSRSSISGNCSLVELLSTIRSLKYLWTTTTPPARIHTYRQTDTQRHKERDRRRYT